ncbi:hypothetical protein [Methanosarcina horonobensis]|uniref:hypothetical protein n=1 Tax=Methanosarcina horonobensis TaxID=418008 RepID=UPI000A625E95|nr:hypothetical protein [Methanosarcina horonobensis]
MPTRPVEIPPERPAERKEEKVPHLARKDPEKLFFGCREEIREARAEKAPEENLDNRPQGKQAASEAEKASMRLEARLKKRAR